MEYFICSRFHSVILSTVFKQKSLILSYSSKINNVINDLNMSEEYYDIEGLNGLEDLKLKEFNELNINDCMLKQSQKQFEEFDRFVKK